MRRTDPILSSTEYEVPTEYSVKPRTIAEFCRACKAAREYADLINRPVTVIAIDYYNNGAVSERTAVVLKPTEEVLRATP